MQVKRQMLHFIIKKIKNLSFSVYFSLFDRDLVLSSLYFML